MYSVFRVLALASMVFGLMLSGGVIHAQPAPGPPFHHSVSVIFPPVLGLDEAFDRVAYVSDTAYVQGTWADWESDAFDGQIAAARTRGLRVYIALDLLSYTGLQREYVVSPSTSVGLFTDAQVMGDYRRLVTYVADRYHPDDYVVLVEGGTQPLWQP